MRRYNLEIVGEAGRVTVELQTLGAHGWIKRYEHELSEARAIELAPIRPGPPRVQIALGGGRRWVYFREVRGMLMGGVPSGETETHYVGWTDGKIQSLIAVLPNDSVRLIQREESNG